MANPWLRLALPKGLEAGALEVFEVRSFEFKPPPNGFEEALVPNGLDDVLELPPKGLEAEPVALGLLMLKPPTPKGDGFVDCDEL